MESNTKLIFDLKDNPDLQASVGGLEPGDSFSFTISGTVAVNSEDRFEGEIEDVEYESAEDEESEVETKKAKVTTKEPAAATIVTETKK